MNFNRRGLSNHPNQGYAQLTDQDKDRDLDYLSILKTIKMSANTNDKNSQNQEAPATDTNTWNRSNFSESSDRLLKEISKHSEGVDLLQLLKMLNKIHPEYGSIDSQVGSRTVSSATGPYEDFILFLQHKEKTLSLSKHTAGQWANEVLSISTIPHDPSFIVGRVFLIASLLSGFAEVFAQLKQDPEWPKHCIKLIQKLNDELVSNAKISYDSLLTEKGHQLLTSLKTASKKDQDKFPEESIIDRSNFSDGPANPEDDSLSRMALAKYLAKRLRHVYNRDIAKGEFGSFFMHIDGAWGSGKSTLLRFLEAELEAKAAPDPKIDPKQKSEGRWVVVNFNAWENQRLDPPWWFIMKTVYREAMKSLKTPKDENIPDNIKAADRKKASKLFFNEQIWRLTTGSNHFLAVVITFLLVIISFFLGVFSETDFNSLPVVQLLTFVGFLWSLGKLFGSSLATGSAKAARSFIEENSKDPMQVLAAHFKEQIEKIGYPVAIFIDDLDRCNKDYGIKLLEGLQTIFKKASVVYVIAADRKWLSRMYENQYEMFASVIQRPAKPFGLIFLDKIFQLIVELPDISSVQKKIYWDNLLGIANPGQQTSVTKDERLTIKEEVQAGVTNASRMNIAARKTDSPAIQQVAREEALGAVSISEEENAVQNRLQNFVDLIEPNPRAMKRLINDISTARAIAFLYNQEVDQDQLILWTILKLQHPSLADFFWNNPQKLSEAVAYSDTSKPFTNDKVYDQLIADNQMKRLFQYDIPELKVLLDADFLEKMKFHVNGNNKKSQR